MISSAWADWWARKAETLLTQGVGAYLIGTVGAGIIIGACSRFGTMRAIRKGDFINGINLTKTDYFPSGLINPNTGEEFFNQNVINADNDITFPKVFKQHSQGAICIAISKAEKLAIKEARKAAIKVSKLEAKAKKLAVKSSEKHTARAKELLAEAKELKKRASPIVYQYLSKVVGCKNLSAMQQAVTTKA